MKIERISENQIKCTLNRSDLASRQIKISELAYGSEKTKGLFQDMMEQASNEVGFDVNDDPLMIEAIPVSMDCIVLMITKVEDSDGVDEHFSDLTRLEDFTSHDKDDIASLLDEKSFKNLLAEVDASLSKEKKPAKNISVDKKVSSMERIFSFGSLDEVINFAHHVSAAYHGENSLYKCNENNRYYLLMDKSDHTVKEFGAVCNSALEYGSKEPYGFARGAFLNEHYELLINKDAIQSLANV